MEKFKFAVELPTLANDPRGFYKKGLVDIILNRYKNLTVAGIDNPDVKRGIEYAGPGNLITFGTAKNHDVNWVARPDYAREKGYKPVYDLIKDWNTIVSKISAFSAEKKRIEDEKRRAEEARLRSMYRNTYVYSGYAEKAIETIYVDGIKVQVFPSFIKVGYTVIPTTAAVKPTVVLSSSELAAVNYLIYKVIR